MPRTSSSGEFRARSSARVSSIPGSESIMTGNGKRETGGVGSGTDYRLGKSHLVCNSRAQRGELLRPTEAEDPLDNPPAAVEQHRVRQPAIVVSLLHSSPAHQDRERRPEAARKIQHLAAIDVVRDRSDGEVAARKLAVQLGHVRELL